MSPRGLSFPAHIHKMSDLSPALHENLLGMIQKRKSSNFFVNFQPINSTKLGRKLPVGSGKELRVTAKQEQQANSL